ncbi:alkaline phosphatase family protein [Patescibacteria group bacterium]|nr:alkaline phosphatase family protein [Candidatus Micrarchaeota archaeon]MBU1758379.1 alkaline phosphatase family protein [Patescibacteria group bacterium]
MIVLGLDGATWDVIKPNLDQLPNFKKLLEKYEHGTLECDVRPVHSGPSWATIFSGLMPEGHGLSYFAMGEEKRKELLERKIFIWDKVKRAIVMGVPISLPPINVNCELRNWEAMVLSTTEEEMYFSTKKMTTETINAIEYGDADLIAVVFSEPDRVQHMFWHQQEVVLKHYQSIDNALGKLMPYLEGKDFLILSDHGFTNVEETRKNNWDTVRESQTGGHHPNGIAISNRKLPEKVSEVFGFLEKSLKSLNSAE